MDSRRLTSDDTIDFLGFMDLIKSLMEAMWEDDAPHFTMTRPHPTDSSNVTMPQIVYSALNIQPGLVGNNTTREIKARVREQTTEYSEIYEKEVPVSYTGQVLDVETVFTIYGSSNEEVFYLTNLFKNLMAEYKGYFLNKGLKGLWWQTDSETEHGLGEGDNYVARNVHFLVRLEDVKRIEHLPLEYLEMLISVAKNKLELNGTLPSREVARFKIKPCKKIDDATKDSEEQNP